VDEVSEGFCSGIVMESCASPANPAFRPEISRVGKRARAVAPVSDWRAPVENRRYFPDTDKVLGQRMAECATINSLRPGLRRF
jgi:hypothetical protein